MYIIEKKIGLFCGMRFLESRDLRIPNMAPSEESVAGDSLFVSIITITITKTHIGFLHLLLSPSSPNTRRSGQIP